MKRRYAVVSLVVVIGLVIFNLFIIQARNQTRGQALLSIDRDDVQQIILLSSGTGGKMTITDSGTMSEIIGVFNDFRYVSREEALETEGFVYAVQFIGHSDEMLYVLSSTLEADGMIYQSREDGYFDDFIAKWMA